jgi:hypothetical protein
MKSILRGFAAFLLLAGVSLVMGGPDFLVSQVYAGPPGWSPTGSLTSARDSHTATLLSNGKVLVVGGFGLSDFLNSCELYEPGGVWSTTGPLHDPRDLHTATLLNNGKVLVAGGYQGYVTYLSGAELFDPDNGTWSIIDPLATGRSVHTATLLSNGKVLVAGGTGNSGWLTSCELYDPTTGTTGRWGDTGPLGTARRYHTANRLNTGKVLAAGGQGAAGILNSAELYNPDSGTWSTTGPLGTARRYHTATLLKNGKVLVAGGYSPTTYLASAELYDPAANGGVGAWSTTGSMAKARYRHTATLLPNGLVLVAGGISGSSVLNDSELYNPDTGTWSAAGVFATGCAAHTAILLPSGKVLTAGGENSDYNAITDAELYRYQTYLPSSFLLLND